MTERKSGRREPRPAGGSNPLATYNAMRELVIIKIMSGWPGRIVDALNREGLRTSALNCPEPGHQLLQEKLEHWLTTRDDDPETLPTIVWLAEQGHPSAREALRRHTTRLLEDPKADLPSSVRTYLGRLINDLIPKHPENRSGVIDNLIRDLAIVGMVDVATAHWRLPKFYSSQRRKSAAWFVALVMTRGGIKLGEQQVRRIYTARKRLADRLNSLFLGGVVVDPDPAF